MTARVWELKVALEAEDVDGGSPDGVGSGEAVGGPLVGFVEVLCAEVVDEREEVGVAQRERDEMGACGGDECDADAAAPGIGIDIEGCELAVMGEVGLLRGARGGEAEDFFARGSDDVVEAAGGEVGGVRELVCRLGGGVGGVAGDVGKIAGFDWAAGFGWVDDVGVGGDDGVGMGRVGVGEIVFRGAVLGAQLIEIAGGEDSGVAVLPGADVDAGDGERVGGLSGAEEHGVSIAERQGTSHPSDKELSPGTPAGNKGPREQERQGAWERGTKGREWPTVNSQ